MAGIKTYSVDLMNIRKDEMKMVDTLKEVAEIVHKIWEKQYDESTKMCLLYPQDITKKELIDAGKKDSRLLSPYTVVKRDSKGKLFAVDYLDEYRSEINQIVELLEKAKSESKYDLLNRYIDTVKNALKTGYFDDILIAYLQNDNPRIEFILGPIETYVDKIAGIKKTFQYNLRVKCESEKCRHYELEDMIKNLSIPRPLESVGSRLTSKNVSFRVDNVLLFAGRQASSLPSSTNLPNESDLVEKYGTKIVIYKNSVEEKFNKRLLPYLKYFNGHFDESAVQSLRTASVFNNALHQISASVVKYSNTQARLGEYNDATMELNADLFGLESAKYHVLNGVYDNKLYENLLLEYVLNALETIIKYKEDPSLIEYIKGFAVSFNYFFKSGALTIQDGKLTIEKTKFSIAIDLLSDILHSIMRSGSWDDADKLFKEFGSFDIFEKIEELVK